MVIQRNNKFIFIKYDYHIYYFTFSNLPNLQELEIGEGCLNEWKDDLVIENYPNLEKIIVKKKSLQNLKSLKICNNEKLKIIDFKNDDNQDDCPFYNVKKVIMESIFYPIS